MLPKELNIDFFKMLEKMGYYIDLLDKDGYYLYSSDYCEELTGITPQNIIGRHVTDIYGKDAVGFKCLSSKKEMRNVITRFSSVDGVDYFWLFDCIPIYIDNNFFGVFGLSKSYSEINFALKDMNIVYVDLHRRIKRDLFSFGDIIFKSDLMDSLINNAKKAALSSSSILITGATGTGKELFAQSIHHYSYFREGPFVAVNCSAIPESLLESTLFGTTKGSYTGAMDKKGLFEEANNGTLFLDELNSMNIEMQAKILRAIQTKSIRRVGGEKDIPINPRIISAVNEDPMNCIEQGKLRMDLFYRLAAISIDIPPLQNRLEDIGPLADHFIEKCNSSYGKNIKCVSSTLMELFRKYKWPGNVRELEHVIEHSMNMVDYDDVMIQECHLPSYFTSQMVKEAQSYEYTDYKKTRARILAETEYNFGRVYISEALEKYHGNITRTASALNLSRQQLHNLINKFDIHI